MSHNSNLYPLCLSYTRVSNFNKALLKFYDITRRLTLEYCDGEKTRVLVARGSLYYISKKSLWQIQAQRTPRLVSK